MNSKYKYLIKNTSVLAISNFSSKLLVFFLVPLYTGVLTPKEYGTFDLISSTIALLTPILTLNIVDGVMRFSMDANESKEEVATIGFIFEFVGCLLFSVIIYINKFFGLIQTICGLENLILMYMFTFVFVSYMTQLSKGQEKIFDMGIAGILGTITSVLLNIYFLLKLKLGFIGFFYASILSSFTQIIYYFFRLKIWQLIRISSVSKRLTKDMVIYSAPIILSTLGWWVNGAADKYIVALFCGVSSNGLLAISYKIPTIINTVLSIFSQAWHISAIKEYENGDDFYKQMFEYYNLLMCVSCSALIMLTRPLASFLFAKDFYSAWQYVPLLLVCSVLSGAGGFIGPMLSARKDSKTLAKSAIISSTTNIILNIILTYLIGIHGAVIATVVSSYVIYLYRKSVIGNKIESKLYSSIMIVWILLIMQSFIEIYLKNYYMQAVIFVTILLLMQKPIRKFLNKFLDRLKKQQVG